jgi:hypothetical protein
MGNNISADDLASAAGSPEATEGAISAQAAEEAVAAKVSLSCVPNPDKQYIDTFLCDAQAPEKKGAVDAKAPEAGNASKAPIEVKACARARFYVSDIIRPTRRTSTRMR